MPWWGLERWEQIDYSQFSEKVCFIFSEVYKFPKADVYIQSNYPSNKELFRLKDNIDLLI